MSAAADSMYMRSSSIKTRVELKLISDHVDHVIILSGRITKKKILTGILRVSVLCDERASDGRLPVSELEHALGISLHDEVHARITEVADPIVDNQRLLLQRKKSFRRHFFSCFW